MTLIHFISTPAQSLQGVIEVPGDKSISHRSIIFGALAKGTTKVFGFLDGEDCMATIKAFQSMGVVIEGPTNQVVMIHGVGKHGLKAPKKAIDCGNSGTTMRLLAGLLAAQQFDSVLTGDQSLLKRPMLRVSKPLSQMGAVIQTTDGKAPLYIKGTQSLNGIDYEIPVVSAQVKSCLLLAGLYAQGETRITETGVSRDHTERMFETFSYPIKIKGSTLSINSDSECKATEITVPGDISSAAFFIVAASVIPGAHIKINHVGVNPTRIGILKILQKMGANIQLLNQRFFGGEPVADLEIAYAPLQGIQIPIEWVPLAIDEFPALFIAAACAQGKTVLHGAEELRFKESDRIGVMVEGLQILGIKAEALDDGIVIEGGTMTSGVVDSYGDHRIAMAFAIAGAVSTGSITIRNCAHVATSFPDFVSTAQRLNLNIRQVHADD